MGLRLYLDAGFALVTEVQFFGVCFRTKQGFGDKQGKRTLADTAGANEQKGAGEFIVRNGISKPVALTMMS
jgi:hypothetical protein